MNPDGTGGGPLEADGSLREAQSTLLGAVAYAVSGNNGIVNLASIGVNLNNDGTLSVDQGTLSAALSTNYSNVQSFLQSTTNGFAGNLSTVLTNLTDAGSGVLGLDVQGISQSSQNLGQQISDLQSALSIKQQAFIKIYSQVNTTHFKSYLFCKPKSASSSPGLSNARTHHNRVSARFRHWRFAGRHRRSAI